MNRLFRRPIEGYKLGILLFCTLLILTFADLAKKMIEHKKRIDFLISREINGIITDSKDESRGSAYLEVKTENDTYQMHSLPLSRRIKINNIQLGDSISKEANSNIMIFYKRKNGEFLECFKYEM